MLMYDTTKMGRLSFASSTVIFTRQLLDLGGVPRSIAATTSQYAGVVSLSRVPLTTISPLVPLIKKGLSPLVA